jgi:uncharacterized protein
MNSTLKENQITIFGVCFLLGLMISAAILGNSIVAFKKYDEQKISVTGAANKTITSNYATWRGHVTCRGTTMGEAYNQLKQDTAKLRAYLVAHQIPENKIQPSSVNTTTLYVKDSRGDNTNRVEGFELMQSLNIASDNVTKVDTISKESNELLNQGLTFVSDAPEYFYTKLDDLKVKMLGEATENARQRAQSMAQSTHNTIGVMRSAQMGVFQITSPNSTDVSDMGINDTESIQKKVVAVVNVSFEVR